MAPIQAKTGINQWQCEMALAYVLDYNTEFTPENFYRAMLYAGVLYPEIVYRQAVLESGGFKSDLFILHNNPFGMKFPITRPSTVKYAASIGRIKNYAGYASWIDAVKDLKLWQNYYLSIGKLSAGMDYYNFLHNLPYATSRNYIKHVKQINLNYGALCSNKLQETEDI